MQGFPFTTSFYSSVPNIGDAPLPIRPRHKAHRASIAGFIRWVLFPFPPTPRKLSLTIAQLARAFAALACCVVIDFGQGWDLQRVKLTRNTLYNLFLLTLSLYPKAAPTILRLSIETLPFVCNHTRYYQYHLDQCAGFILRELPDAQIAESP